MMRLGPLLPALMLLVCCGVEKKKQGRSAAHEISSSTPGATFHEDLASHPESVQAVAKADRRYSTGLIN